MKRLFLFSLMLLFGVTFYAQQAFDAPFGTKVGKEGTWTIYRDDFEDTQVAMPKNLGWTFSDSAFIPMGLSVYFYFISDAAVNAKAVTIYCRLEFSSTTVDYGSAIDRIIFMDGSKNKLKLTINPSINQKVTKPLPDNPYVSNEVLIKVTLSKEQFTAMCEMLRKKDVICAVYTRENSAAKLKQYSKRMNTVTNSTLDYYISHFSDYKIISNDDVIVE